jgi:uncharacterized damage-inducible protein DinB
MNTTDVRRLAAYNRWMNGRLYGVCAQLSDEARKRDRGAFFRSIHGTLNHLLLADRLWMSRFTGSLFSVDSLDQELFAAFDELSAARAETDARIEAWAAELTDRQLGGVLEFTSMVDTKPRRLPMSLAVAHLFNHQTHHRGQLTTLLSQLGMDYGVTDLIWLPEAGTQPG